MSHFLDSKFGFLPIVIPITEPAIGYGAAGGLAFIDKPLGGGGAGFGRPNITMVGGFATENGTWGAMLGDLRHWKGDRLQTLAGVLYMSANLDFYGIGDDPTLTQGVRYNLEPKGLLIRAKYRIGPRSRAWAGLGYVFSATDVAFDADSTTALSGHDEQADLGAITPSITFDSRDNFFTPLRGTYVDLTARFFGPALGGDDVFENVSLLLIQYVPLCQTLFLGMRGDAKASFGDAPFYLMPYISLRGAPILRYQGEAVAHSELELRWQCWRRFSLVGFGGFGAAWNNANRPAEGGRTIGTGGGGFRYELARRYGIHAGLDVGFGPDETAIYVQVGSAWARP